MRFFTTVMTLWLCAAQAQAVPTETFVFISEATPKSQRLELGNAATLEIRNQAEQRDYFHFISTPQHQQIVSIAVPEGAKAARLRRHQLVAELNLLKKWLTQADHGNSDQLKLYGVPETIANLRKYPDSRCRVVCVGTPIFKDEYYAGTNMIDANGNGLIPQDGTLQPGSTSPLAPGITALPKGTVATWITRTSLWGANGSRRHRQGLVRFYRLWFQSQNDSMLARFSSSPASAFDFSRAKGYVRLHLRAEGDEMQLVADATSLGVADNPAVKKVAITTESPAQIEAKRSSLPGDVWKKYIEKYERLRTGVVVRLDYCADQSADTSTDVDLRLVDNATGKEVWYEQNNVTGLGILMNDMRSGAACDSKTPQPGGRYEFLYLDPQRELSTCTLWVNKYVGVGEVFGEVSLFADGKVVGTKQFTFTTPLGDLGAQADNRASSGNWISISLTELAQY